MTGRYSSFGRAICACAALLSGCGDEGDAGGEGGALGASGGEGGAGAGSGDGAEAASSGAGAGQTTGGASGGEGGAGAGGGGASAYEPPAVVVRDAGQTSADLRCEIPIAQALTPTVKVGAVGSHATSVVGLDAGVSALGALFELKNNASPHYVNVLETRSGAGAAWQTSSLVYDNPGGVGILVFNQSAGNSVFNQSAGNSVGFQWAYGTTASATGPRSIETSAWTPVPSDHVHGEPGGHSPCNSTGHLFDDTKQEIFGHEVPTAHGKATLWQNVVTFRARVAQSWPHWKAEQAFYLSRGVARAGDLRVYLGRGDAVHGPIRPYDAGFTIPGASCTHGSGTYCNTAAYDYAVLVWNVHGLDVGVALDDVPAISLNLEDRVYCASPTDDACGNINFHAWFETVSPAKFAKGQKRTHHKNYYVGTLAQLRDLGFVTED